MITYVVQQRSEKIPDGFLYLRHCGTSSQCDLIESLTTPTYNIRYSTKCCTTDACLPTVPVLSKEKKDNKNGVICPACHSTKDKLCTPKRSMECTGDETHCIYFNETMLRAYTLHSYGCGTTNIFREKGRIVHTLIFYSTIEISEKKSTLGLQIGNFLWCHVCHEESAASCSKHRILCGPDEDVCITERRRITDEQSRRLTMQIKRRCGRSAECQFTGVITSKANLLSIITSCCNTDMCTTPEPQWSLKRRKNNGKTCPGCFPTNNTNCRATDVVKCNGEETHCIYYSTTIKEDTYTSSDTHHGCSSPGICEHETNKHFEMREFKTLITTEIICSRGIQVIHQLLNLVISKCAAWSLLKLS
ncbi:uncharacterized protein [Dendropsophus ebraccatus]|uniref:uncharacterized protein n=1 Tax=Dendropsophus ebraccatus TaxID=150705 RepID=UPI003831750F